MPLRFLGSYFDFIPARLGHNAALDGAVLSLCAMYSGSLTTSYAAQKAIYGSYARALSSLRHCLNDKSLQMEPETLCASILLQIGELVVNVDMGKWGSLSRGTMLSSNLEACTGTTMLSTTLCSSHSFLTLYVLPSYLKVLVVKLLTLNTFRAVGSVHEIWRELFPELARVACLIDG